LRFFSCILGNYCANLPFASKFIINNSNYNKNSEEGRNAHGWGIWGFNKPTGILSKCSYRYLALRYFLAILRSMPVEKNTSYEIKGSLNLQEYG
jgi:hypothetical protein